MSSKISLDWAGETLELLGDKAIYWPRTGSLIIADPHFGKPSSFRSVGIPVPVGTTRSDLQRLNILLEQTAATRLIVLGDFFHDRTGQCDHTMGQLATWRQTHPDLRILIVMGNHDRHSSAPPAEWNIDYQRHPVQEGPFLLCHEPCESECGKVLSGHIHPAISLHDGIGHSMRIPCFLFSQRYALLPAFGSFTGTANIRPTPGDKIYALTEGQVIPIPSK